MGWDAFAFDRDGNEDHNLHDDILKSFRYIFRYVRLKAGSVDGYLDTAALDVSTCAKYVEWFTSYSAWGPPIPPEYLQQLDESLFEYFSAPPEEQWALLSAKYFVKVCIKHNLGIRFSY